MKRNFKKVSFLTANSQQPTANSQQPTASLLKYFCLQIVIFFLLTVPVKAFSSNVSDYVFPSQTRYIEYSITGYPPSTNLSEVSAAYCASQQASHPTVTYNCPSEIGPPILFFENYYYRILYADYSSTSPYFSVKHARMTGIYFTPIPICDNPTYPRAIDFDGDKKIDICIKQTTCPDTSLSILQDTSGLKPEASDKVGNPISCSSGQKVQMETVYSSKGNDPLSYKTYYSSPAYNEITGSLESSFDSTVGIQRGDNQFRKIELIYNKNDGQVYRITYRNCFSHIFYGKDPTLGGAIFFQSNIQNSGYLRVNSNGTFEQTTAKGVIYNFNSNGQLTSRVLANGTMRTYT